MPAPHGHDRDVDVAALVQQLGAERFVEAVFGAAVGGLQWNRADTQRRAHLHDRAAVAGAHPAQRCHRAVHTTQVGDLGDAAELVRVDLVERHEYRREGVVDPHVDRPDLAFDTVGHRVDRTGVGHIQFDSSRRAAGPSNLGCRRARLQHDVCAPRVETAGDGPPDPCARACDDDDRGTRDGPPPRVGRRS